MNNKVVLVGFYNEKALGVRYLANALKANGFEPTIVFFKSFNSKTPKLVTEKELELLRDLIKKTDPLFVGLSVMSSLCLSESDKVNKMVRENFSCPCVWGGVHATLITERSARECSLVIRGEGEDSIVALAKALQNGEDWHGIESIAYIDENGKYVENEMGILHTDIDRYGYPVIDGENMFLIDNDSLTEGDPQLKSFVYELACSRGCPFTCTYCGAVCVKRVYEEKGKKFLRFRTVDCIMEELHKAKEKMPRLRVVHFWDEVFPSDEKWIDEFTRRYKEEIGIPFRIWGHPTIVKDELFKKLVDAGLHQIEMGIQSGSPYIRKEIFHRYESQEQVIEASRVLSRQHVPVVYFDFMICHPFETQEQLEETFNLCLQLEPPFKITMHGLAFFPATDICQMAIDRGIYTEEEMEHLMYGPIQDQFNHLYGSYYEDTSLRNKWRDLIALTQYPEVREQVKEYAKDPILNSEKIETLKKKMERKDKINYYVERIKLILKIGK